MTAMVKFMFIVFTKVIALISGGSSTPRLEAWFRIFAKNAERERSVPVRRGLGAQTIVLAKKKPHTTARLLLYSLMYFII
jgi:hypothetical protein